jgi:hypothetical protein
MRSSSFASSSNSCSSAARAAIADSVSRSCGQLDRPFPGGGSYDDSGVLARGEAAALFEILGGQPAQMLIID